MKQIIYGQKKILPFIFLVIALTACSSSISLFNQQAYDLAVSLKVESLALMNNATEPYENHQDDVEKLKLKLQYGLEYAKGRKKNEISTRQWQILINPERNLLGGFLKFWQEKNTLSPAFIDGSKEQVGASFDSIIGLESGKINPDEIK